MDYPHLNKSVLTLDEKLYAIEIWRYMRVYRPLYEESNLLFAASIFTAEDQILVNKKFSNAEEQQQWLDRLNTAIRECGVPGDLILIPDGSFIRAGLIKYAKSRRVGLGHTIELYGHVPPKGSRDPKDKPLVTALFESKETAMEFFNSLAARLNKAQ